MNISDDKFLVSQLGFRFTSEAVQVMRKFSEDLRKNKANTLVWTVAFDREKHLIIGLSGDYIPQPLAVVDQVEDVVFFWYSDPPGLEALRRYCIDAGMTRPSRLIDLPPDYPR